MSELVVNTVEYLQLSHTFLTALVKYGDTVNH